MYTRIREAIKSGDAEKSAEYTTKALAEGYSSKSILDKSVLAALLDINKLFVEDEFYITEIFLAARAAKATMERLKLDATYPPIKKSYSKTVVIGTVSGDIHDLGKMIIIAVLESLGFTVFDLGVDVSAETFVDSIRKHNPDIVMLSSLLTTTMNEMKTVVDKIKENSLNDKLFIMVGGGPVTQKFAENIGADAYADDPEDMMEWLVTTIIPEDY